MMKFYKNLIKSVLFGILIVSGFIYVSLGIINIEGEYAGVVIMGLAIISTMLYCTYKIIDTIKEYCSK